MRAPQSAEELRQEVEWLRRKAEGAREDCRQAESAARERAAARQRPLTLEELNADSSLANARRRYNKYSATVLQALLAPARGSVGPRLMPTPTP